jgi:hypothetical protein
VNKKSNPRQASSQKRAKSEADSPETQSLKRGAISIFILFHLIAITCWAVPATFPPLAVIRELVRPYMQWTGLFQAWDTFAPNPKSINIYVKTAVITRDRHIHVWAFPRMEELSYGERYREERYRKFAEVLPEPVNAILWPDALKRLAWQFNSPTDPPDEVMLIKFQSDIKPGTDERLEPAPKPTVFFEDYVQPGDLK